ncbi:hypothetical protein NE857_31415 [Nocardiopsis exhalans]|uniref:Uncharacterized protein n=2 Tax=Nocardiopsis exhalans TaxID=163604 RepID=A0ABY5D8Y0_9ACTN|nr:hypothetical protein [Nocardiopsis exhalans]USY19688.1 hypothetical protein NE857_31415 [Nocardiopsis exhalans]
MSTIAADLFPAFIAIALAAAISLGYALGAENALLALRGMWRARAETRRVRREMAATVVELNDTRAELADERALVARLAGGTDDIIRAARGAHHRQEDRADA